MDRKGERSARKQIAQKRRHRTTPDPQPTRQGDYTAFMGTGGTEESRPLEVVQSQTTDPRRSGREKRTQRHQQDQYTDDYPKVDNLGVYAVEGVRYRLFAKQERIICVYHWKIISRKKAYAKQNKSNQIVAELNHYKLPLCIDGWDETRGICYNMDGYGHIYHRLGRRTRKVEHRIYCRRL